MNKTTKEHSLPFLTKKYRKKEIERRTKRETQGKNTLVDELLCSVA